MTKKKQPSAPVLRAYVWCPMNDGQMLVEFTHGDTIRDLLKVIRQKWGIKLPMAKTRRGEFFAGWNVLGQTDDGSYLPLHVDDQIPCSPKELGEWTGTGVIEEKKDPSKAGRDRHRWILTHGMYVGIAAPGEQNARDESFDGMVPARSLKWPQSGDSADITLCIVTAIAGG